MMRTPVVVLSAAAMLGACSRKVERRDVEKLDMADLKAGAEATVTQEATRE